MCAPSLRSPSTTASIRSVSFARSSAAPRRTLSPRAWTARSAKSGSSSTRQRHLARAHLGADELGRADVEVAAGLAADPPAVEDGDAAAHPLEHVEEADPPRVQVDAVHGQLGAGEERRRGDERRRGREVARHLDRAQLEPLDRPDGRALLPAPDPRARGLEHRLGVVAGRQRLDDCRLAFARVEPGEQDRRLHLRARDRQLVRDRLDVAALDRQRRVSVGRLDRDAHSPQRLGDPLHRAGAQRLVSGEREASRLAGEDPGQEPHQRAGVRAVDRAARRFQPA